MKKFLAPVVASFVLLLFGSAFAQQTTASHDLQVTIPQVVMIRIVAVTPGTPASVVFDYADPANQATYFAALESAAGSSWLPATSHNLGDVEVLAVGTAWRVTVGTTGTFATTGVGMDDVRVQPTGAAALGDFFLSTGTDIAVGSATVWQSLGISGDDYALFVDGTESDGDDTITVTYSVFAN